MLLPPSESISDVHDAQNEGLRSDLAAVVIDGDIVVYDSRRAESHVLSGGAVAVWMALEDGGVTGVVARVANAVGLEPDVLADDVDGVVQSFRDLGFFDRLPPAGAIDAGGPGSGSDG